MKLNYLFPNKYKKIGWFIFIPSAIIGLTTLIFEFEPNSLDFNIPAIFINKLFRGKHFIGIVNNNILNEILGVLVILSSLLVAFSKEELEDEYISKIRLESLVWAVYLNYAILLISFLFIFDLSFLWVMIFNMFTILVFFMIRFNSQISKLKKSTRYEE
jgi:Ca2+-dependent lipid-binding protein